MDKEIKFSVDNIQKNISALGLYIENEDKFETSLLEMNEKLKNAYESDNSGLLYDIGTIISDSIHVKKKNLNSYKLYTEKHLNEFINVNLEAEKESENLADKFSF